MPHVQASLGVQARIRSGKLSFSLLRAPYLFVISLRFHACVAARTLAVGPLIGRDELVGTLSHACLQIMRAGCNTVSHMRLQHSLSSYA